MSDKIINGDLLRFYQPKGFKKVDPSQFDYTKREDSSADDQKNKQKPDH